MDLTLAISSSSSSLSSFSHIRTPSVLNPLRSTLKPPSTLRFSVPKPCVTIRASSKSTSNDSSHNPFLQNLKTTAKAIVFTAVTTAAVVGKFHQLPSRAESPPTLTEELTANEVEETQLEEKPQDSSSPLSEFLDSNSKVIDALKSLLQEKLEAGEDEEALKTLEKLVSAQPDQTEWKFLKARLLNEMGETQEARNVFEEILKLTPLSFEALFENALLMDRCGEGGAVIGRLEEALRIAEDGNKVKEARDVRLIMAQIQFLQKNVDEALRSYQELSKEDPNDFRPYFCQGMIYSLLDRNKEAREQFAKYRELSPKKFEVEGYLRSPLSRMKLFGSNEEN
ncbi:protein SLOW GREEN 1, chloroplastic [Cornus florida]|uniref:protein SLOW GREEN 1, chloroplastic n=1 Tax=Cornus florida TaxID=4283 RepID=UPI00289F57F0|nr:protein SLOW GREEN 1, chloroplastic [Cornus florida]